MWDNIIPEENWDCHTYSYKYYDFNFPKLLTNEQRKLMCSLVNSDEIEINPMAPCSGLIFNMKYKYGKIKK